MYGPAIASQTGLGKTRELLAERDRRFEGSPRVDQAVGEAHAQRLFAVDAASGEDEIHGAP